MSFKKRHLAAFAGLAAAVVLLDTLPGSVFGRQIDGPELTLQSSSDEQDMVQLPAVVMPDALKKAAIDPTEGPWGDSVLAYPANDFDRTLQCLAMNIYWEARSEPDLGQVAVAAVTLNRANHKAFPNDVCGVVQQGGAERRHLCQFSWWCDGKSDLPREDKAWDESMELARHVLDGELDDPTDGAMWYHADYVKPAWSRKKVRVAKIGRHIFYRALKPGERLKDSVAMN
ncbi:MAG: cell wall hydrolase [Magnetovibrionaceae bacterium]